MDPNIWGSHAWLFLHTVTLNYPDEPTRFDKENYKHFFENLGHVIPCEVCKSHYKQNIRKYPIQLDSKESLTKWLHHIHNLVNIKNGKDEFKYDDLIKKYSDLYSDNNPQKVSLLILFIIVCVTVYYLYKNYKK